MTDHAVTEPTPASDEPRMISLADFLEPEEIDAFRHCWEFFKLHRRTCQHCAKSYDTYVHMAEVKLAERITRINSKLGEENDPRYLAYAVLAVMMAADRIGLGAPPADQGEAN